MNTCGMMAGCLLTKTGHQTSRFMEGGCILFNASGTWSPENCGDLHHFICNKLMVNIFEQMIFRVITSWRCH